MTCTACTEAQSNPHMGRFDMGCRACNVRHVALMPQLHRRISIDEISPDNRDAFVEEVKTEMRRINGAAGVEARLVDAQDEIRELRERLKERA